jgi:hypothetical protein
MRGKTWCVDGRFFEVKNVPLSSTIFSVFSTDDKAALVRAAFLD